MTDWNVPHSRLSAALAQGKSLDECFAENGSPGLQALRRVGLAGQRNRQRILAMAAQALGFATLDTISDNAAAPSAPHRGCIPAIDITYNSLRKVDGVPRSTYQYSSGCVDAQLPRPSFTPGSPSRSLSVGGDGLPIASSVTFGKRARTQKVCLDVQRLLNVFN